MYKKKTSAYARNAYSAETSVWLDACEMFPKINYRINPKTRIDFAAYYHERAVQIHS